MNRGNHLGFFQRIRMKYKVSVLNENTLEELLHWRVSALLFFFWVSLLAVVVVAVFASLMIFTPLRNLLPENVEVGLRKEVVRQAIVVDSLSNEVYLRQAYINTFRDVVMGNIAIDTTLQADQILAHERDEQLLEKSEKEKEFCENFEEAEQFNISANTTELVVTAPVFMKPVKGLITAQFDATKNHLGIDLQTEKGSPVLSVFSGVVLFAGYNPQEGYIVQIVHPQNYISVYKGASMIFKKSGDIVKTGEVIALMDDKLPHSSLHFELWNGMQSLNPTKYIIIE